MSTHSSYCSFCGSDAVEQINGGHLHCTTCGKTNYINLSCAVWCFLIDTAGRVGVAKRARDPWKGLYDEAWWFADQGDSSCEATVIRELSEELGITIKKENLHYLSSHALLYEYQWRHTPVMSLIFFAHISDDEKQHIRCTDDVADFQRVDSSTYDPKMFCTPFQARQVAYLLDQFYQ